MRTLAKIIAPAALVIFAAGACGKGNDCAAVKDKVVSLAKADMDKAAKEAKSDAEKQMASMGAAMLEPVAKMVEEQCKSQKWSQKTIDCALAAKTSEDMGKCEGFKMGM